VGGAKAGKGLPGVIFWRNLRPADLATLLTAIAETARKPRKSAERRTPADLPSTGSGHFDAQKHPLATGRGAGD